MSRLLLGSGGYRTTERRERLTEAMRAHFEGVDRILFVPFAVGDHDAVLRVMAEKGFGAGFPLDGLHRCPDPVAAIEKAEAVYVGGGNTFRLVDSLQRLGLLEPIRRRVADGMPYMGVSAGSNVACPTLCTTNDMPIVFPPSFDALGLVPFNINPHYIDPDPASTHMGETRQTRIKEFHVFNPQPVIGLREGALLEINGNSMRLQGTTGGRLFRPGSEPEELGAGAQLDYLLAKSP